MHSLLVLATSKEMVSFGRHTEKYGAPLYLEGLFPRSQPLSEVLIPGGLCEVQVPALFAPVSRIVVARRSEYRVSVVARFGYPATKRFFQCRTCIRVSVVAEFKRRTSNEEN